MAERHSPQNEDPSDERARDPFAELALIIGFDPRQKIRGSAAAAPAPQPASARRPPEEAPDASEAGHPPAMPEEVKAQAKADPNADLHQEALEDRGDLPPLELDLPEAVETGAEASAPRVEAKADNEWDEEDSGASFLDDESWQQAVAASLDRITGEINEQAGRQPIPSDIGPSGDPSPTSPSAAQLGPEGERLNFGLPSPLDPLDEELAIDAAEWDLLELDAVADNDRSSDQAAREASDEPQAPEPLAHSAEPADDFLQDSDFGDELDLDDELAQSIERELEVAWSDDIAAAQVSGGAVQAREPTGMQRPEPLDDGAEQEAFDRDVDDAHLNDHEPAARPERNAEQDRTVSVEQDELWADVSELEFEEIGLDEPQFEPAPGLEAASDGLQPAPSLHEAHAPEADFEAELAALLAEDDEPSGGPPEAPMTVADIRQAPGLRALEDAPWTQVQAPENPAVTAQGRGREFAAASAESPRQELQPAAPRPEPVQAAPESLRPLSRQPSPPPAEDDPFAALAAMAARYRSGGAARPNFPAPAPEPKTAQPAAPVPEAVSPPVEQRVEQEDTVEVMRSQPPSRHEMPEIETVDVSEPAVALADDLDIPEVPVERPRAARAPFDDLDTEFAELLQEMTEGRRAAASPSSFRPAWETRSPRAPVAQDFSHASVQHEPHGYAAPAVEEMFDADEHAAAAGWRHADEERDVTDARAAEAIEGFEQEEDGSAARGRGRRGVWLASLVAGAVITGGLGAYAVGSGGIAISGAPALIKADAEPIKVRPKDPGGVKVPNQDNKVYQRVASGPLDTPMQAKLVASAEEPVSLVEPVQPTPPADDLSLDVDGESIEAIVKVDERFAPTPAESADAAPDSVEEEAVVVVPRKVRTMTVRADGTLVPNEAAPAETPQALVEPKVAAAQDAIRKVSGATEAQPLSADVVATGAVPEAAQPQPIAVAAQPGAWSMQIASQPSEEGARNAYGDLAKRFGGVLGDRGVNIVKAEIDGKGTFWRVRIPAESRNDAVSLCESYKSAGGSCFVSK